MSTARRSSDLPMGDRPNIALTGEEVQALLARTPELVFAAIGPGGWPVATLAPARVDEGRIIVDVAVDDLVAASVADGGAVCCVGDEARSYFEIKGVIVRGRVAGVDRDGPVQHVDMRIEHVTSFDFAKLPEATR
jgi:hypothetical protein